MMAIIFRISEEFLFQLVLAELIFCAKYKRRKGYFFRALSFVLVMTCIYDFAAHQIPHPESQFLINISISLAFIATLFCLWWCHECKFHEILFSGVGAYAMQNLAYNLWRVFKTTFGYSEATIVSFWVNIAVFSFVYTAVYFLFIKKMDRYKMKEINRLRNLINTIFILLLTTFFSTLIPDNGESSMVLFLLYAVVGDILVLCIHFDLFNESKLRRQNEMLEQILIEEKRQYQMTKENIELINMKCHDLKHQIRAIRLMKDEDLREEAIREIEQAVLVYDSSIKSGNDTLDVLFMEKSLACEKYHIKLTCIADGSGINFMKPYDIYSVFGNLIDNAMESVRKEKDIEKRIISLNIGRKGKIVRIHIENYFAGELHFEGELPETTKNDKRMHGYGMMSVRHIIKKYNGNMVVSAGEGSFTVNILLPLPL